MTIVNVGTTANDGTGDTLRQALILINQEFAQYAGQGFLTVKYIGAAASNPTARLDAAALQRGDFYLHTPSTTFRFYNGSAWVEAADLEAVNRVLAECEMARDTAYGTARIYANTAAALADGALAVGQYFAVLSADSREVAIIYLKSAGPAATDTGKRVPAADAVQRPAWAGKRNGWPDSFFHETAYLVTDTILQQVRWWSADLNYNSWAILANSQFDGQMLRKTGSGDLSGPIIRLADLGLVAGDTLTACILVKGSGATACFYARFSTDDGTWVGVQLPAGYNDAGTQNVVTSATPQRLSIEGVVPATATQLRLYPAATAAGVTFDIVALWSFKGAKATGPSWPTMPDTDHETRLVATEGVASKPLGAGKKNGWPDPFFRTFDIAAANNYGRSRWNGNTTGAAWSKVANAIFNGFALRRTADVLAGTLGGPKIWMDDLGAVAGDTITVYGLFVGDGGVRIFMPAAFYTTPGAQVGGQIESVNDAGGASLTNQGATPRWLKHEVVVPATATWMWLYPYTNTAGKTFDMVAVWAFKGAATTGPVWPTLEDPSNMAYTLADHETRIAANTLNTPAISYAVEGTGVVTSSAEAVSLAVTNPSNLTRDLTFRGWGDTYVPAGVSFNALRIKSISRTAALESSKWCTLHIMVRTGAGSHLGASTVVAVGSTTVPKHRDVLTNITILLKDPVTGAPKTLNDASFSGGEYFIGVYASNDVGAPASCGQPLGTMPNHLGVIGYYTTDANPLTTNWVAAVPGYRHGFDHLLLTSPVEGLQYAPGTVMLADILAAAAATSPAPELVLPPTIYGVQGREGNVYLDNITPAAVADQFDWAVAQSASLGKHEQSRYTLTPAGAITSGTVTFSAHDRRTGALLASATAQLRAAASSAGSGTTKKVLVVGDSLVNAGVITQTLLDVAAGDVMGITLLGTRGSGANKHEGRGGWRIDDYTGPGRTAEVPPNPNPFWIGGAVNVPQYLADNTIHIPDWFFVHLGINDIFGQTTDANAVLMAGNQFTALDTLIASMKAAGASVKVALVIPSPPTLSQDAFGNDYGVGLGQTRWRFKRNILIWAREMITRYGGQEASRIYLVPSNLALDTANNMVTTSGAINSRNAATVARQSNSVHPATSGYQQIGDAWWAFLKANA